MAIILTSIRSTLKHYKLVLAVSFLTALVAWPSFLSVHSVLTEELASTAAAGEWLRDFNFGYLYEIITQQPSFSTGTFKFVGASLVVFGFASILLSAGAFGYVRRTTDGPMPNAFLPSFLHDGGLYFGRFLRIGLWVFASMLLSLLPLAAGAGGLFVTVPLLAFILINADVTRVRIVENNERSVSNHYFTTMPFVIRKFGIFAGYYLVSCIVLVAGFYLYRTIDTSFKADSVVAIAAMATLQQLFVIFRSAIRLQIVVMVTLVCDRNKPMPVPQTQATDPSSLLGTT